MTTIIRWFPPSWLQIKTNRQVIYIDPAWIQKNFENYPQKIIYSHYPQPMDGLPEPDLEKADIILYTHHHQDHIKTATLHRLATHKTRIIAPEKCRRFIDREFEVIRPTDTKKSADVEIQAVFAYNTLEGRSTRKQHKKGEGVGYIISINGKKIYHAGDTDVIPEMKEINQIDIAFLPISGTFTMDIEEAVEAVKIIKPKIVVPMHFLDKDPNDFKIKLEKLSSTKPIVLNIGETLSL